MIGAEGFVLSVVCLVLTIYWWVLLAAVVLSWAEAFGFRRPYAGPGRVVLDGLDAATQPVLRPLRNLIPPVRAGGVGFDLSVLLAFVILWVLRVVLHC